MSGCGGIQIFLMDIGSAIAVFLVLSMMMLALFCFVTKYFHYKLKRTVQECNEIYSVVDEIYQQSEEEVEGEFEEYKGRSADNRAKPEKEVDQEMCIEMSDIKTPLNDQQDLYKPSQLRARLNASAFQPISKQESSRDISSLKSFRPDKLNTSGRTQRQSKDRPEEAPSKHTFINKLVRYDHEGLTVYEVNVKMIRKVSAGVVKESKSCKLHVISNSQENFEDHLDSMGFEVGLYGCYQYETSVDVANIKTDENYLVKSLKTTEAKRQITEEEFANHSAELAQIARPNQ